MTKRMLLVVAALLVVSVANLSAQGQGQGRGRGQGQGQGQGQGKDPGKGQGTDVKISATFVFGDSDRVAFRDYFVRHKVVAQPLPPGIAKNVARGKPLPPGIAKKALPADLILVVSPRAGRDVTFSIVGDTVVALRSGVVVDVMVGVFR